MISKTTGEINGLLRSWLPVEPTAGQRGFAELFSLFLTDSERFKIFVLKGYAGTGKTTLMGGITKALPGIKLKTVLLAPTGRAAKVLSGYSGKNALTIHKKIYQIRTKNGYSFFELVPNLHTDTLFIIDEASMIAGSENMHEQGFGRRDLLEDLLRYVYRGKNCAVIFVGDDAQLPPVGSAYSPALDKAYIEDNFRLKVYETVLKEVVRQKEESGILYNATSLRMQLLSGKNGFPRLDAGYKDVLCIDGVELQEKLENEFSSAGKNEVIIITRSNKRANLFNFEVRNRVFWIENELNAGDRLMVVKNNYYWLEEGSAAGFIANGDFLEVQKVKRVYEKYGFTFADASVIMPDYAGEESLEVKLILTTLKTESASLPAEQLKNLFTSLEEEYAGENDRQKRREKIFSDPHYNALQVKFAWAVTCHKAQGGQWPVVFIDPGFITEEMIDTEYFRWLYTAVTRATGKVYFVNFDPKFFGDTES